MTEQADQFASGVIREENLSGGVFRSLTPNTIPGISMSDIDNMDMENSGLRTRSGMEAFSTAGHKPGCLKFGFSDSKRCHYLRVIGGAFEPTPASDTYWNMFCYAKENSPQNTTRTLFCITNTTDQELMKLQWTSANGLELNFKETNSDTWNTVSYTTTTKSQFSDYLFGVSLAFVNTTVTASILNANSELVSTAFTMTAVTWDDFDRIIVGCDSNLSYPETDWTNALNYSMLGLFGELALTKNINPTGTTLNENWSVIPPVYQTPDANKIAYYPLRTDYDDAWGSEPAFKPTDIFRSGSGLAFYKVEDPELSSLRWPLYCNRSWHVNTIGEQKYISMKSPYISSTYLAYISVANDYTMTFDIQPMRTKSGTSDFNLFKTTSAGPYVSLSRVNDFETQIKYKHIWNTTGITATSNEVTLNIDNEGTYKISCEHTYSGTTGTLKIFKNLGVGTSGSIQTADAIRSGTTATWSIGHLDVSDKDYEFYLSGLTFHSTAVGTSWGERPPADVRELTTFTETITPIYEDVPLWEIPGVGIKGPTTSVRTGETIEIKEVGTGLLGLGENPKAYGFDDMPQFQNVRTMYFYNDYTGYDTGTSLQPHGIIMNQRDIGRTFGSDSGTDLYIRGNTSPYWVCDRSEIVSTGYLDDVYAQDVDDIFVYQPNDASPAELVMSRNVSLTNTSGTTVQFTDTYKYFDRTSQKLRGFMYAQNLYLHNEDYYLRYNGKSLSPLYVPTPTIPLELGTSTTATGLNGYYAYCYTFVGKSGIESYQSPITTTSITTGTIRVHGELEIFDQSYVNEVVTQLNFYRNRGTTVATTNRSQDSGDTMYLDKTLPIEVVKARAGEGNDSTWYTDRVGDDFLIDKNPPRPNTADIVPPCKYSALYNDRAYFTGNKNAPDHVYKTVAGRPELLDLIDEFRSEDGEDCTGIAGLGYGVVVFKKARRKYYPAGVGSGERPFEYRGGCVSHDSLVSIDNQIFGLGNGGFFICDGHNYRDISTIVEGGRAVSSVQYDIDNVVTQANKESSIAVYHEATHRYICKIGTDMYVFHLDRRRWVIYRNVVGKPVVWGDDLYMYLNGRVYKEVSGDSTIGTDAVKGSVSSGAVGYIEISTTDTVPTTSEEGLPCYIDNTKYDVTNIDDLGSDNYKVWLNTNTDFSSSVRYHLGSLRCYAETKFFDARTPGKNKLFFYPLTVSHNATTDGEIRLRYARNNGSFDNSFDNFVADTNIDKIQTIMRVRSENVALKFEMVDGKDHTIRSFSFPYKQDSDL